MTKKELTCHMELKKRLAADLELLASMEAVARPRAQRLGEIPQPPGAQDVPGDLAAEIADIKIKISRLEAEIARSEAGVVAYISAIKDTRTSMIFRLRFLCGMTWKEVATNIGWITASGVKAICYRYLARGGSVKMGRPRKKQG